jgi:hypothetical protein
MRLIFYAIIMSELQVRLFRRRFFWFTEKRIARRRRRFSFLTTVVYDTMTFHSSCASTADFADKDKHVVSSKDSNNRRNNYCLYYILKGKLLVVHIALPRSVDRSRLERHRD